MTDAASKSGAVSARTQKLQARLKSRYARETRFKWFGRGAIAVALAFLVILLTSIVMQGYTAFYTHSLTLPVYMDPARIDRAYPQGTNFEQLVAEQQLLRMGVTDDENGSKASAMRALLSSELKFIAAERIRAQPALIGQTVPVTTPLSDDAEMYLKGKITLDTPEDLRRVSDAVWLEEYAPRNRLTAIIEVNINNLAAVPSIVYGLLGLALFINFLHLPRASPLVGGPVLALMALPTIIIATRSALKAVPPSIRDAALAMGASRTQTVFGHVLPLAMPGVMTGSIIAMAHALGETAPLLLIGMISFVPGISAAIDAPAGALPSLIYIWENASERAFHERTAAAILVLLAFMIVMNAAAILLRRRFERRW